MEPAGIPATGDDAAGNGDLSSPTSNQPPPSPLSRSETNNHHRLVMVVRRRPNRRERERGGEKRESREERKNRRSKVRTAGRFVYPLVSSSDSVQVSGTGSRVRVTAVVQVPGGHRQDTAAMVTARVVAVVNIVRSTSDTGQRAVQVQVKQSTGRFGLRVFGSAGFQVSVRCFVYSSDEFHRELTRSTQPSQLGKRQKVNSAFGSAVLVDSLVRISRFRLD
ncbi:uncharacterized protein LOC118482904 [Helianthus annuus]|uniref:uncharacterized protein LOC118482904 n=1 Tax=Helianthus annuus TaxID=4232 RepID=UPI001652BE4E|nr:uncharacterized protein LOC118482904 [Helianthus annuus]